MKLSVSISDEDVALLDDYVRLHGVASRSAAMQQAIRLLRHRDIEADYSAAWSEWQDSGDQAAWEGTTNDGYSRVAG